MGISIPDTLTADNSGKYIMSIRLRSDGLSFSGYEPSVGGSFFYREVEFDRAVSFIYSLKDFLFAHEFLTWTYKCLNVVCVDPKYTILPASYWIDDKENDVLDYCFSSFNKHGFSDVLSESQMRLLFGLEEEVYEFCSRSLLRPQFFHYMTAPLLLWKRRSAVALSRQMCVMIEKKRMDIACFSQDKLLFVNTFAINQLNDILYYLLFVWKQVGFDPEKDELNLFCDLSLRIRLMERLRVYLRHVKPMDIPAETYLFGADISRAPFDIISLLI